MTDIKPAKIVDTPTISLSGHFRATDNTKVNAARAAASLHLQDGHTGLQISTAGYLYEAVEKLSRDIRGKVPVAAITALAERYLEEHHPSELTASMATRECRRLEAELGFGPGM